MFRNSVSQRLLPQRHRVCVTDVAKPRLKALCQSTTPNIIFGATVKDTKRMTFSIFNVPKAKPPKNTPKDHIWSNWTLFVYKEAFSILPSWLLTWKSWGFLICRHQPHYSDRAEGSEHLQSTNRAHSCQSIILNVLRNVNSCWVLSRCLLLFVCIVHRLY